MQRLFAIACACFLAFSATGARAQQQTPAPPSPTPVAGEIPLGVTVIELRAIVTGWSAKKDLLGKTVQNDKKEKLGKIEDIIISPKTSVSHAIIGVGGFLGIGERLVAIPIGQLRVTNGQLVLPGATKDVLKAMPPFVYSH
jgi:sporulation protein YlmC with PRC-barrel domain